MNLLKIRYSISSKCKNRAYYYYRAEEIFPDLSKFELVVNSDGCVHWEPAGLFKTVCDIDVTYYPNDKQVLSFVIKIKHHNIWQSMRLK